MCVVGVLLYEQTEWPARAEQKARAQQHIKRDVRQDGYMVHVTYLVVLCDVAMQRCARSVVCLPAGQPGYLAGGD